MSSLCGVKVLDLSRVLAGPCCGQLFADLGANVIKVEDREGDENRRWLPVVNGRSANYTSVNRGKRGITLNLKERRGQEILERLVQRSDVLIENFLPDTARRLGLTWERLSAVNEQLIHVSITGYGSRGPFKDRPGYDNMLQAFSGMMAMTGEPNGEPVRLGPSLIDLGTGVLAFGGACAALLAREQGRAKGQHVEVSLLQTAMFQLGYHLTAYTMAGVIPEQTGSALWHLVPYQAFRTADGWVLAGATNDATWQRMAAMLEVPEIAADPRYSTARGRSEHRNELVGQLIPLFLRRRTHEWVAAFDSAKVPCSPILDVSQALAHPQVVAMGVVKEASEPGKDRLKLCNVPIEMSATPPVPGSLPPALGEHTDSVLAAELKLSKKEIDTLRVDGVI